MPCANCRPRHVACICGGAFGNISRAPTMNTILLADDKKNIREFCRQGLEADGYRVVLARDGREAVELFHSERPDAVVLDIHMPRSDGLEAVEMMSAIDPATPIVFFTSSEEDWLDDRRSRLAAACVEKREDLSELRSTITSLLKKRNDKKFFA
jgi:CheY-like chemotaxis protein